MSGTSTGCPTCGNTIFPHECVAVGPIYSGAIPASSETAELVRRLMAHLTPLSTHHNARPDPNRCDLCAAASTITSSADAIKWWENTCTWWMEQAKEGWVRRDEQELSPAR